MLLSLTPHNKKLNHLDGGAMSKKEKRAAVLASVGPYAAETLLLVVLPLLYVCLMSA